MVSELDVGMNQASGSGFFLLMAEHSLPCRFSRITMMIHTGCLSVPQQKPPVVLRTLSHELSESIEGISLNLPCLKIALLLPLTSVQWVSDLGVLLVYSGPLRTKVGYLSAKPLVCTVYKNIPFSFSSLCAKVLESSLSSLLKTA